MAVSPVGRAARACTGAYASSTCALAARPSPKAFHSALASGAWGQACRRLSPTQQACEVRVFTKVALLFENQMPLGHLLPCWSLAQKRSEA